MSLNSKSYLLPSFSLFPRSSSSSRPQTGDDPIGVAVRSASLSDRRGGGRRGFGSAGRSAAESHRTEDAESSGAAGGDETAGLTASSMSSSSRYQK